MAKSKKSKKIPLEDRVACGNCSYAGNINDHDPNWAGAISDLIERISPGEEVPVGECPKCESLVHLVQNPRLAAFAAELRAEVTAVSHLKSALPMTVTEALQRISKTISRMAPVRR